jgi:hypothetical protein
MGPAGKLPLKLPKATSKNAAAPMTAKTKSKSGSAMKMMLSMVCRLTRASRVVPLENKLTPARDLQLLYRMLGDACRHCSGLFRRACVPILSALMC